MPRFACPECASGARRSRQTTACRARGVRSRVRAPRRRLALPDADARRAARAVRRASIAPSASARDAGRRSPEYYRCCRSVAADDPHAGDWRIRRETYHHLLRHVLAGGPQPMHGLDVGAGSGWLCASSRLARPSRRRGRRDRRRGRRPGRGAALHDRSFPSCRPTSMRCRSRRAVRLDRLQRVAALRGRYRRRRSHSAHRLLAPGGALVVMDSPMFRADRDGAAMVDDTDAPLCASTAASARSFGPAPAT